MNNSVFLSAGIAGYFNKQLDEFQAQIQACIDKYSGRTVELRPLEIVEDELDTKVLEAGTNGNDEEL